MKFSYFTKELHTVVPFGIARGTTSQVGNLFVNIDEGLGEGAPTKFFNEYLDVILKNIDKVPDVLGDDPYQIESILEKVEVATHSRVLKCAVDIALYDLMGKQLNQPIYKLFGLSKEKAPQTSFTIGIAETAEMVRKAVEAKDYPVLKIKLGGPDDMNVMRLIREALPKHVLRVDCNCGWTVDNAIGYIDELAELGIEFIEQPLPPEDEAGLLKIFKQSKLPVILDESVRDSKDIPKVAQYCHGVNLKLMKTGGIREAVRVIHSARAHGLSVMIGCMLESSVGITAAAQITPMVDYADLDGNILLADDPYDGLKLENGWIRLPEGPGLGVTAK